VLEGEELDFSEDAIDSEAAGRAGSDGSALYA